MQSLDHIALAVFDLKSAVETYQKQLGFKLHDVTEVQSEQVKIAVLTSGQTRVELLEPIGDASPISLFLKQRGQGLHHMAYQVADIDLEIQKLKAQNIRFIEPAPRLGAHGCQVAFLHPKSCQGVLIELVQRP